MPIAVSMECESQSVMYMYVEQKLQAFEKSSCYNYVQTKQSFIVVVVCSGLSEVFPKDSTTWFTKAVQFSLVT